MGELVNTLTVSLDLSRLAVYYDSKEKYVPAIHYYDLCLLHLDESLTKLPVNSVESEKVVALRNQYQDRMVYLRRFGDILSSQKTQKDDNSTMISSQKEVTSKDRYLQNDENTLERRRRQSCVRLDPKLFGQSQDSLQIMDQAAIKSISDKFEKPPKSAQSLPYWQLARISQSVHSGSLLSENLYIPKYVWAQYDTRFAGIQVKIGAYRDIIDMVKKKVEILITQYDIKRKSTESENEIVRQLTDNDLQDLAQTLKMSRNEFTMLQNQLSRAFSYIEEVQSQDDSSSSHFVEDDRNQVGSIEDTDDALQLSNPENIVTPVIGEEEMLRSPKTNPSSSQTSDTDKEESSNSRMSSIMGGLTFEALGSVGGAIGGVMTSGMNQGISLVGSLGKNAKKYAEVGLSRIGAMYSKVTHEELDTYTTLVVELGDKMQYFDDIFYTVEKYRSILINLEEKSENDDAKLLKKVQMTETILTLLLHISKFTKDVLCNLILRDLQDLLATYLAKRNKELLTVEYLDETMGAFFNSTLKSFNLGGQENE